MEKASPFTYLARKAKNAFNFNNHQEKQQPLQLLLSISKPKIKQQQELDLNVFIVKFDAMKDVLKNIAGGDPYSCQTCKAFLNKYSKILNNQQFQQQSKEKLKIQLKPSQSVWICQFCGNQNILSIEKQQIPKIDDIFYMLQSQHQKLATQNDATTVFCIDTSGSMNTTTQVSGKMDLKFGLSQQQINMLKQFMQPGDQAQFNFLPGQHNKDKTFVSRKQCVLSAIQSHLQELKKSDPFKRIGFVTFNNQVTVIGDKKSNTVNIVGDKLYKKDQILNSLKDFKLTQPLAEVYDSLVNNLNKTEAKGQTALGPALISAIQIAAKGSPGSTVTLCTDGLANIGLGALQPLSQQSKKFYQQLSVLAKQHNVTVNIMTIKGQGCKMQVIGQVAEATNGNVKVVNPQKLSQDFANVMKDQVVGVNVQTRIMLHKAMRFRNQDESYLKQGKSVLNKQIPNATVNTKISFEYELKPDQELQALGVDVQSIKNIPFQAQIIFTSPKGGKFLRVISSETKATMQKEELKKQANLPVIHHRVAQITAKLYDKGDIKNTRAVNKNWTNYLNKNFTQQKYQKKQQQFEQKNDRLKRAIRHKYKKQKAEKRQKQKEKGEEEQCLSSEQQRQLQRPKSVIAQDSDEDDMQFKNHKLGKGGFYFSKQEQQE